MEIRPNVRYPDQTEAAIVLSSARPRRGGARLSSAGWTGEHWRLILPVRRANSRLQTGLFVTMQVPPLVPSLLHPKRSLSGNKNLSPFPRSTNTGPWLIFAIILLGLLVALMRRPELRHSVIPALLVTFAF